MKKIIKFAALSAAGLALTVSNHVFAQQAESLTDLLQRVEADAVAESQEHREREQRFQQQVNEQQQILDETRNRVAQEEQTNVDLEAQFEVNRQTLAERREQLRLERADLNELLGTIQGVAGDMRSIFENSLISAQYDGREEFLSCSC